jgi:hypothetical protein
VEEIAMARDSGVVIVLFAMAIACVHLVRPTPDTQPDHLEDLRAILDAHDRMSRGFADRDVEAIAALRTPAFTIEYPGGRIDDAARAKAALKQWFARDRAPIAVRYALQSIEELTADRAVLVILQRQLDRDVTQRETWVRTSSGWRTASIVRIVDEPDVTRART